MKRMSPEKYLQIIDSIPQDISTELDITFGISIKLIKLLKKNNLSKKEFAESFGCKPSEVTRWLSGTHNFTIKTIAKLSTYFNEPFITVNS